MVASTAKVPLPWIGTATCVPATPASAARRVRMPSDRAMKAASREPQSRSMAALVRADVGQGAGGQQQGFGLAHAARVSQMRRAGQEQAA